MQDATSAHNRSMILKMALQAASDSQRELAQGDATTTFHPEPSMC